MKKKVFLRNYLHFSFVHCHGVIFPEKSTLSTTGCLHYKATACPNWNNEYIAVNGTWKCTQFTVGNGVKPFIKFYTVKF